MWVPIVLLAVSAAEIGPAEHVEVKPAGDKDVATVTVAQVEQWFDSIRHRFRPCVLKAVGPHPLTNGSEMQSEMLSLFGYMVVEHGRVPSELAKLRFSFDKNGKMGGLLAGPVSTLLEDHCAQAVYRELRMEGASNERVELSFRVTATLVDVGTLVREARREVAQYCGWLEGIRQGRGPKAIVDLVQSAAKKDAFLFASGTWSEREDLTPFARRIGSGLQHVGPCEREAVFAEMLAELGAPKMECGALRAWAREDAEALGKKCAE
jgi:hypothetical protein